MSEEPIKPMLSDQDVIQLDDLCSKLVDETITEEEHALLEAWILKSEAAREHYIKVLQLSASLHEYAEEPSRAEDDDKVTSVIIHSKKSVLFNPLSTAAAGLLIGVFSTMFANSYLDASPYIRKAYEIIMESFEHEPAPMQKGLPLEANVWSGDFSQVIGEDQGLEPIQGKKMLKLLSAAYEDKPIKSGFMADLYRFVDLRNYSPILKSKPHKIKVSAKFNHIGNREDSDINGYISLLTLNNFDKVSIASGKVNVLRKFNVLINGAAASTNRRVPLSNDGGQWEYIDCELLLPAETKVVFVQISMVDLKKQNPKYVVEFEGSYIDDIRITLEENSEPLL